MELIIFAIVKVKNIINIKISNHEQKSTFNYL